MAKEIILYNLRDDAKEEDYVEWCKTYKGPLLLGQKGARSFTLLKMMGGISGNGQQGVPPEPAASPYKFIGIMDVTSLEDWKEAHETKAFKEEFFPQWFSKWVADFYVLGGVEVYYGQNP
ncbi:MAG: hypothetical protein JRH13_06615 [Deltaproteobacteria bacterium]|nr:hypothetical protein [Deltaproteobacteria bacterium]MBW2016021.1 hypothetical protein [Deltaproteobacteria bacterium]MBW2129020.1 hypothetical protein [Deltaproteobacteria bacterium]